MKKKKLILINPRGKHSIGFVVNRESRFPPLGLGIVAALTPDDWDIKIIDENYEEFIFEEADLVGITSFTSTITRAYDIASIYRKKNIPVVIGGIHASMMPEETEKYADVVAMGEAESVWKNILIDFEKGKLKKRYFGVQLPLSESPAARHDLFHEDYIIDSVQTTRGCPMRCDFCSVHTFNGSAYRTRPVEEVLDELEATTKPNLFFVDDNIVGYNKPARDHAKAIFRGMIERGIKKDWFCQASINFSDDEELLDLAAKAGCRLVLIGVESEKTEALEGMNKRTNLKAGAENYSKKFAKIQSYGITVLGTFIFGLDTDDLQDCNNRVEYILNSNADANQVSILTPFPGTHTYDTYVKEKRLTATNYPEDWEKYWGGHVVIQPKKMTSKELEDFKFEAIDKLYNKKRLLIKMRQTLKNTRNAKAAIWAFSANANYNNMVYEKDESKHIILRDLLGNMVEV